ncbi:hypothetical protein [Nannocystis sp. SCPEA4]|uniref:hypothetical protein n=1 Tax=Nannocystis sp. SCPEA4 TaxID=2996787 RepID=UPI0022703C8E|nr:hypothetical protein [Nannocystis sp. SCPEA4]MCY1061426.1 hypothetical protein [Nannocystis sp. SCPEA4]
MVEVVVTGDVVSVVASVVEPTVVVVGSVDVGSPVLVPGFEVAVDVPGSVAAESDELSDVLTPSVDWATSSEQAENSEDATSTRVSEARLRKRAAPEDGGAAGPHCDIAARRTGTLSKLSRGTPRSSAARREVTRHRRARGPTRRDALAAA